MIRDFSFFEILSIAAGTKATILLSLIAFVGGGIGGLIVAQIVTLFITPAIFLYFEWIQEHILDRVPLLRSARTAVKVDMRRRNAAVSMVRSESDSRSWETMR